MTFTDKEIQLARDMKEAGLEWKPEVGDWFTSSHPDATPSFLCVKVDNPWLVHTHGECHIDASIRLPSWHQCREILTGNGIRIHLDEQHWNDGNPVELCCWQKKEAGTTFIGSVKAETDLEAMYQAILMWVLGAPRIADDVEAGN